MQRLRWLTVAAFVGFATLAWMLGGTSENISVAQTVRKPPPGWGFQPPAPEGARTYEAVNAVHAKHHVNLLRKKGLIGVGIIADPAKKDEFALRIFTTGNPKPVVPAEIDGVPVYERYLTEGFELQQTPIYQLPLARPVPIGVSTANANAGVCYRGTLGCRLIRPRDGARFMMSNNHVWGLLNDAAANDPLMQPGFFAQPNICFPNDPLFYIGNLTHFVPYNFSGQNIYDVAIGSTTPDMVGVSTLLSGYGTPTRNVFPVEIGTAVQKFGSTTGYTAGFVVGTDFSLLVNDGTGRLVFFVKQMVIIPAAGFNTFSAGGDSGSLVVDIDNNPVALLFAGGGGLTFANQLPPLLHFYRMRVDDGGLFTTGADTPPLGKRLKPVGKPR